MSVTTTNLIQGPATFYGGIFGVAEPATVSAVPGVGWADFGATSGGVDVTVELSFSELDVDQVVDIPGQRITKRVTKMATNLAEPTLANWAIALNELAATVTAATYTPSNGLATFNPPYAALLLDGIAPGGFRRRIIIRKALQTGKPKSSFKKDGQNFIPVEFTGHFVSSAIAPFTILDALV